MFTCPVDVACNVELLVVTFPVVVLGCVVDPLVVLPRGDVEAVVWEVGVVVVVDFVPVLPELVIDPVRDGVLAVEVAPEAVVAVVA